VDFWGDSVEVMAQWIPLPKRGRIRSIARLLQKGLKFLQLGFHGTKFRLTSGLLLRSAIQNG